MSRLKPIQQLLDLIPPLLPDLIQLAQWMAECYVCMPAAALHVMIPGAIKKGNGRRLFSLEKLPLPIYTLSDLYPIMKVTYASEMKSRRLTINANLYQISCLLMPI